MQLRTILGQCFALFDGRDKLKLVLLTLAQMMIAILDILGVLLIGLLLAIGLGSENASNLSPLFTSLASRLGVDLGSDDQSLILLSITAALLLIMKSLFSFLLTRRTFRFLSLRQAMISAKLMSELLNSGLKSINRWSPQEISYAVTVGSQYATIGIIGGISSAIAEISLLLVMFVGLASVDWVVTLWAATFFGLVAAAMYLAMSRWATSVGKIGSDAEISSVKSVYDALSTFRETYVLQRTDFYSQQFESLRYRVADVAADIYMIQAIPKYIFEIALVVGAGALAFSQLPNGLASAVTLMGIFLVASTRVVPAVLRLQVAGLNLKSASGMVEPMLRIKSELQRMHYSNTSSGETSLGVTPQRDKSFDPAQIQISDLWYRYQDANEFALQGINLQIRCGESIAIAGPSGSGKTTLVDNILGLLTPQRGLILIHGQDPRSYLLKHPGTVSYVPQSVAITNGTVRENVALALSESQIDDDKIWDALEVACIAQFLREAREGLDTIVGERGMALSGGQRQRLGLARALYVDPEILVLDEATSALDADTEYNIVEVLAQLPGEITKITVAHRLSTVLSCDRLVYMEYGKIIQQGSFDYVRSVNTDFDRQASILGL